MYGRLSKAKVVTTVVGVHHRVRLSFKAQAKGAVAVACRTYSISLVDNLSLEASKRRYLRSDDW